MKPRVLIAESRLPDDSVLALHEHDGRHYLTIDGATTAGPATRASEEGLARLATSPFRPVRQPRIWLAGLGLGAVLAAALEALPQKRGLFHVAEPSRELPEWLREHLAPDFLEDKRVEIGHDPGVAGLRAGADPWHLLLVHADTAPQRPGARALFDDRAWLAAAYDSLREGGLLAIASSRPLPKIERTLSKAGFEVVRHEIDAAPNARRPRRHHLWLARKGKGRD